MFDFFRKKLNKKLVSKGESKDNISKEDMFVSYTTYKSIENSVENAKIKFDKPEYNPQTRQDVYDNVYSHKKALDAAFDNGETVRDSYTGAELLRTQEEAKLKYGDDWQLHVAEADHIDTLNKVVERHQNDAFIAKEDLRDVGNREDNFQVISRASNQSSKDMGKGGSTQKEWAKDKERMKGMAENIEDGSIDQVKRKIRYRGDTAEKKTDDLLNKKAIENVIQTGNEAGLNTGINAGFSAGIVSIIDNIVDLAKGEKTVSEAISSVTKIAGKATIKGYVQGASLTVITQKMRYSSSEFLKCLANNNVPTQALMAVQVAGNALGKWMNGEISTQECFLQIGGNGLNVAAMPYWAGAGQCLIPIPVVGAAVGAWLGSVLTNSFIARYMNQVKKWEYETNEMKRIISECEELTKRYKVYRTEFEKYISDYLQDYSDCFESAMSDIQKSFELGNADGVIKGANQITRKLSGVVRFENVSEFKEFLNDDSTDEF